MLILQATLILFLLRNFYVIDGQTITSNGCPSLFWRVTGIGSEYCYGISAFKMDWDGALGLCSTTAGKLSRPTMIPNATEHRAITIILGSDVVANYLKDHAHCDTSSGVLLWTAGHRKYYDCTKDFLWDDIQQDYRMTYQAWRPNQPDCWNGTEKCVEVKIDRDPLYHARYNDMPCTDNLCALCRIRSTILNDTSG